MKNGSVTNRPTQNQFRWSVGHLLIAFESAFLPIPTRFCLALIEIFVKHLYIIKKSQVNKNKLKI